MSCQFSCKLCILKITEHSEALLSFLQRRAFSSTQQLDFSTFFVAGQIVWLQANTSCSAWDSSSRIHFSGDPRCPPKCFQCEHRSNLNPCPKPGCSSQPLAVALAQALSARVPRQSCRVRVPSRADESRCRICFRASQGLGAGLACGNEERRDHPYTQLPESK